MALLLQLLAGFTGMVVLIVYKKFQVLKTNQWFIISNLSLSLIAVEGSSLVVGLFQPFLTSHYINSISMSLSKVINIT